jgi:hypothetical protein
MDLSRGLGDVYKRQALRLWLKGIPFYGHPSKQPE